MAVALPESFKHSAAERRLLPFIGSGFSKNVSPSMPDWSEVIRAVASQLGFDEAVLLAQADYLQIAEFLSLRYKSGALYNELSNSFNNPAFSVTTSHPHRLLPYVDAANIFTTNWDSWIEKGFDSEGVPYKTIVERHDFLDRIAAPKVRTGSELFSDADLKNLRRNFGSSTIVKFHGDFTAHDSIVFAEQKYYDRMDFEDPLDLYLRSEILGRSVVFIGYSFSDQNVRLLWHKLNKILRRLNPADVPKSFFVTSTQSQVQTEVLRSKNIEVITLDPLDIEGSLTSLLEQTIDLQK